MQDDNQPSHVMSYGSLIGILVLLLILTGITIGISTIHLGKMNVWIALSIATIKSCLVILFFMHMKFENRATQLSFIVTICFVAILIGFVFWDIVYR